ncbi:hypothetical protein [Cryptosporangium sp. NPDC048952]|uniref:hypothetical protein n=1 Tax=Cryptosporangium sp. NPDC048952 TaxID=3363961 RepID=UPI003724358D
MTPSTTAELTRVDARTWTATGAGPLEFGFPPGPVFLLDGDHVLPGGGTGRDRCWVLPAAAGTAWLISADGEISAEQGHVRVHAGTATLVEHRARPHADVTGAEFTLDFPGADELADAFAGFYWGTMLPSVVERTLAADYPDSEGYVLSTLADKYAGTYPDVDHEFQVKGRIAAGSTLDLAVVRRMIELQLRMMREDPQQLWRDPCAVQPDGTREYHVRRNSRDGRENAVMFLVTGNVEVIESIWLYVARSKDLDWLRAHIDDIEGAASCVEDCMDPLGRLWSDVYYEDQVIKDGRETMAASLAAHSFELLASLEALLGRDGSRWLTLAEKLTAAIAQPLPVGYWDPEHNRFVDWVDRSAVVHDHVHLLANVLPVLFGQADVDQARDVLALVERELDEFQRFPTFLAARIADYTDSEIGDGGPYDLCAAGRYWCWDAAFWSWRRNGRMLFDQLTTVARQGAAEDYVMGERYDMNHVYYTDGTPWHGAAHYYEYPCVFTWVLFCEFLGVRPSLDADLAVAPRLVSPGTVTLPQDAYQLHYAYRPDGFTLQNLASTPRTFALDLRALFPAEPRTVELGPGETLTVAREDRLPRRTPR